MVLDGTILAPVKNPLNSFKRYNRSITDSVLQKQTPDIGTLIKPSQNDVVEAAPKTDSVLQKQTHTGNVIKRTQNDAVETVRMKVADNRRQSILINQLTALSQSLRHELLRELDSSGKRTENPDNKKVHNKSKSLNSVKDIPATNSKTFDSRKDKFSGLYFVRDKSGRVVFRRVYQNSTERTAAEHLSPTKNVEVELSTIVNIANEKEAVNSSQSRFTTKAGIRKPHIYTYETKGTTDVLGSIHFTSGSDSQSLKPLHDNYVLYMTHIVFTFN